MCLDRSHESHYSQKIKKMMNDEDTKQSMCQLTKFNLYKMSKLNLINQSINLILQLTKSYNNQKEEFDY